MSDKKIIVAGGGALAVAVALYFLLKKPVVPGEYTCPYCGEIFGTYDELVAHIQAEHPGERIPLPIEWE